MNKITLLFLILISAFLSCKKSGPDNYITAEMDGKPMNFGPGGATRLPNAGVDEIVIFGKGPAYRGDGFSLMIDNAPGGKAITAGTYYDTSSDFNVTFYYTVLVGRSYEAIFVGPCR